jgi:hypothetical protein
MATVPGDPNESGPDPYGGIPQGLRPSYPELLMAAAIHKQQQGIPEGVVAKPGRAVQPVDVGGGIANVREEFGRAAAEMTGVADAVRAIRGEMTPEEAQTFALGAVPALVPGGKVAGEVAEVAPGVMRGIRAFHGSPHDFPAFDISKIGTGEGAQAYGHGLYFAENPAVAQDYRRNLSGRGQSDINETGNYWLSRNNYDKDAAVADATKTLGGITPDIEQAIRSYNPGKTYEVNINADPEHFLDWDKPLSEQSDHVKNKLAAMGYDPVGELDPTNKYSGERIYRNIVTTENFARKLPPDWPRTKLDASQTLRQGGIPGIKYLDQGSRAGGKGTYNYVVFDDKLIDIVKKYGIAGLIGANVAHFKTGPGQADNGNGAQ